MRLRLTCPRLLPLAWRERGRRSRTRAFTCGLRLALRRRSCIGRGATWAASSSREHRTRSPPPISDRGARRRRRRHASCGVLLLVEVDVDRAQCARAASQTVRPGFTPGARARARLLRGQRGAYMCLPPVGAFMLGAARKIIAAARADPANAASTCRRGAARRPVTPSGPLAAPAASFRNSPPRQTSPAAAATSTAERQENGRRRIVALHHQGKYARRGAVPPSATRRVRRPQQRARQTTADVTRLASSSCTFAAGIVGRCGC